MPQTDALIGRVRRVQAETERSLASLDAEYQRNKDLVTGMLLKVVMSIDNPYAEAVAANAAVEAEPKIDEAERSPVLAGAEPARAVINPPAC